MEIISLTILTRRGVVVNQVQLVDVDDIAAPIQEVTPGGNSLFTLRELKKGPFSSHNTNTGIQEYTASETLVQIATLAGNIFTANILTYKGRTRSAFLGFNAQFVAGTIIPWLGGSKFYYQEDSDPDLVEYTCRETPAQILTQLQNNILFSGWKLNGNTNGIEKYIGTNDNYNFPVRTNGVEMFRFNADGSIKYPQGASLGYVLESDAIGNASWQPGSGSVATTSLDPAISHISTPPGGPATGDRYLVLATGTGAWVGQDNNVAEWDGTAWVFTIPALADYIYITDTLTTLQWDGTAWIVKPGISILQNGNTLGASGVRIGSNDAFPIWLKTNNTLRVRIDGTTGGVRMVSSLQVGYLATAPIAQFQVRGSGNTSATVNMKLTDIGGAELFNVLDDGSVGVATIAPLAMFHVNKSGVGTVMLGNFLDNAGGWFHVASVSGGNGILFSNGGTSTGDTTSYRVQIMGGIGGDIRVFDNLGAIKVAIKGDAGAMANRIRLITDGGADSLLVNALTGQINSLTVKVGNAGLVTGDLYKDTAANILANGDYVIGMKA